MPQLVAGLLFVVTVPPSAEGCAGDLLDPPAPCTLAEDFRKPNVARNIVLSSLGFVVVAVALTVLNWRCDFPAQVFALADAEERALLKTLKAEEAVTGPAPFKALVS